MFKKITISILILIFSFTIGFGAAWLWQHKQVEILNQRIEKISEDLQDANLQSKLDFINDSVIVLKLIENYSLDELEEVLWSRTEIGLFNMKNLFSYDEKGYYVSSSSIDSYKDSLEYVQEKAELRGRTELAETAKEIINALKVR